MIEPHTRRHIIPKVSPEGIDTRNSSEKLHETIPTQNHIYTEITAREIADEMQCTHFAMENGVDLRI
jgi:hypothetical protein